MADDVHEMLDDSMLIGSGFAEGECDIGLSFLSPASLPLSLFFYWAQASSEDTFALAPCRSLWQRSEVQN